MARKLKLPILVLSFFIFPSIAATPLVLQGAGKKLEFKVTKSGLFISESKPNSHADKTLQLLTKVKLQELLKKKSDLRLSPGVRLCDALKGKVWVLEDEKKLEWSICQFDDGSALLTDDLGKLSQTLN